MTKKPPSGELRRTTMTTKSYYANLADNLFIALFVSIIGLSMMLSGCDKGDESVPCNENPNLTRECVQEGLL